MQSFPAPATNISRNCRSWLLLSFLLGGLFLLSGCQTTAPEEEPPFSVQVPIGRVIAVYPADRSVIIQQSGDSFPDRTAEGTWLTRNQAGTMTSLLSPTPVQRGRAWGFRLVEGRPNIGDDLYFRATPAR